MSDKAAPPVENIKPEEAFKRASEDFTQFSLYARNSAQIAIAANGGALIAIMTLLTGIATKEAASSPVDLSAVVSGFKIAAIFYLSGVVLCAVAMYLLSLSKFYWGLLWEDAAFTKDYNFKSYFARRGGLFNRIAFVFLFLSVVAFVPGSFIAVQGFQLEEDAPPAGR